MQKVSQNASPYAICPWNIYIYLIMSKKHFTFLIIREICLSTFTDMLILYNVIKLLGYYWAFKSWPLIPICLYITQYNINPIYYQLKWCLTFWFISVLYLYSIIFLQFACFNRLFRGSSYKVRENIKQKLNYNTNNKTRFRNVLQILLYSWFGGL